MVCQLPYSVYKVVISSIYIDLFSEVTPEIYYNKFTCTVTSLAQDFSMRLLLQPLE